MLPDSLEMKHTFTTEPRLQLHNTCSNVSNTHTSCSARFLADVRHAASNGGWSLNDTERMWKRLIVANFKARLISQHLRPQIRIEYGAIKSVNILCEIWGYQSSVGEDPGLLRCDAVSFGISGRFESPQCHYLQYQAVHEEGSCGKIGCVVLTQQHSFVSQKTRIFGKKEK